MAMGHGSWVTKDDLFPSLGRMTPRPTGRLGGVTVRASDLRSNGRGFDSLSGGYQAT